MGNAITQQPAGPSCGPDLIEELIRLRHSGASLERIADRFGTTPGFVVALTDLFEHSLKASGER